MGKKKNEEKYNYKKLCKICNERFLNLYCISLFIIIGSLPKKCNKYY